MRFAKRAEPRLPVPDDGRSDGGSVEGEGRGEDRGDTHPVRHEVSDREPRMVDDGVAPKAGLVVGLHHVDAVFPHLAEAREHLEHVVRFAGLPDHLGIHADRHHVDIDRVVVDAIAADKALEVPVGGDARAQPQPGQLLGDGDVGLDVAAGSRTEDRDHRCVSCVVASGARQSTIAGTGPGETAWGRHARHGREGSGRRPVRGRGLWWPHGDESSVIGPSATRL